ncbi:hypothetical protein NX784_19750 [Massilia pinisoli]|uniref:Uncharacterized protein n=1 Tax=Massilia pinisoli TaxID=1772194 RepID=A0ABT1ZV87_9BURK|nr:hypothetical protein [Massilia pinisoli]MCS0583833.1 hypothetical protein [Massilia pinisoli]
MKKKYEVKAGDDFDVINVTVKGKTEGVVVTVNVNKSSEKKGEPARWDWKVVAVMAAAVLVFSSGAYAAISKDYTIFDQVMDVVASGLQHAFEKSDAAEKADKNDAGTT